MKEKNFVVLSWYNKEKNPLHQPILGKFYSAVNQYDIEKNEYSKNSYDVFYEDKLCDWFYVEQEKINIINTCIFFSEENNKNYLFKIFYIN